MTPLPLLERAERVVCLGAHPDDIEIGCGGTMVTLSRRNPDAEVHWVVLTSDPVRVGEASRSAESHLGDATAVTVHAFRDNRLPYDDPGAVKDAVAAAGEQSPDLVFAPRRDDAHQDHRFVGELAWQVFRRATILEYEIAKWDGDLRPANVFVPLDEGDLERKVDLLFQAFVSQHDKPWFDREAFTGLARLRGLECGAPSGYAEAFHGSKLVVA